MDQDDFRFKISAEKYLERYDVLHYVEDAVAGLLEHREENPKVNPAKFFSDYFTSVREGNHVIFREYSYVSATAHNRACFVRTFWKCFRHIGRKGDLLSVREYHSLIQLLCPDFPFQPVQKTARIILMEDAMDCLISFTDFLLAFQAQFYYDEFLSRCAEVYQALQQDPHLSPDPVVVPTSEEMAPPVHPPSQLNGNHVTGDQSDGVDSMLFFRALLPVCEKLDLKAPPTPVLRDLLSMAKRVTFYGFLVALARSEALNTAIGKLPSKSELLDVGDQDLSAVHPRPGSASAQPPSVPSSHLVGHSGTKPSSDDLATLRSRPKKLAMRKGPHQPIRRAVAPRQDSDDDDDDDDDSSDSDSTN